MTTERVEIGASDRRLFEDQYEGLRRFAAVTAPMDIEPDDLLQDALVRVLSRGPLSDRDNPVAYLRRTIVNPWRSIMHDVEMFIARRWVAGLHRASSSTHIRLTLTFCKSCHRVHEPSCTYRRSMVTATAR